MNYWFCFVLLCFIIAEKRVVVVVVVVINNIVVVAAGTLRHCREYNALSLIIIVVLAL